MEGSEASQNAGYEMQLRLEMGKLHLVGKEGCDDCVVCFNSFCQCMSDLSTVSPS